MKRLDNFHLGAALLNMIPTGIVNSVRAAGGSRRIDNALKRERKARQYRNDERARIRASLKAQGLGNNVYSWPPKQEP